MYPTGKKIGINSVENAFFGGQNSLFFFDIQKQIYIQKQFIYFEQGGKYFIYFEQNEKDFIYFHIFLNPPPFPPPQLCQIVG